jgi:thiamine monophosphate synthase
MLNRDRHQGERDLVGDQRFEISDPRSSESALRIHQLCSARKKPLIVGGQCVECISTDDVHRGQNDRLAAQDNAQR